MYLKSGLILLLHLNIVSSCRIWGADTGECSLKTLDRTWRMQNMPFCQDFVIYPACLPKQQTLPPSREYPEGRWINYTVLTKDQWVEKSCRDWTGYRRTAETNPDYRVAGTNEFGQKGKMIKRFWHNKDCQDAYQAYFCYINFPRCDNDLQQSLPTCRSACENYFKSCMYSPDLWRCYNSKYFNGPGPETPGPNKTYLRDFFPGQPFRKNKFTTAGVPVPECTPAILGSAPSANHAPYRLQIVCFILVLVFSWVFV